jgi:protein-S-isoprenylcysteine O-methyltransferase Ste14
VVIRSKVLVTVQFLSLILLILLPYSRKRTLLTDVAAGTLIFLALIILSIAGLNLRPALTVMPEPKIGAPFITTGIYRIVRHPMYLAVILIGVGLTVSKFSLLRALITVILIVDLKIKQRYEDRLLLAKWPQARQYQAEVGALFPNILRS